MACERPGKHGVAISQWDCRELARQLRTEGAVEDISPQTVRRILAHHHLKPWRHHLWLSSHVPRDAAFAAAIREICDLYTRTLEKHEAVLCVDEKTSLQPRQRTAPTRPALPGRPVQVEQEYIRGNALNLFAAFDTRTGKVIGWSAARKRADEFISFLELLEGMLPAALTAVHVVLDNLRVHKCKAVRAWLLEHSRFIFHFPPVHCSWMNQVEQWFSILQRKALRIADFDGLLALDRHLHQFFAHWNRYAHPFNWNTNSVAKVMAKCSVDDRLPAAA